MPDEAKPRCDECRFWDQHNRNGSCRRYPPTVNPPATDGFSVIARHQSLSGSQLEAFTHYPQTTGHDWCGEFKAKE